MIGGQRNEPGCSCFQISTGAARVPQKDLHPVGALRTKDDDRARERSFRENLRYQSSEPVGSLPKIRRLHCQRHARPGRDLDHRRGADARTARSTSVIMALSISDAIRTTAPASLTSIAAGYVRHSRPWHQALRDNARLPADGHRRTFRPASDDMRPPKPPARVDGQGDRPRDRKECRAGGQRSRALREGTVSST